MLFYTLPFSGQPRLKLLSTQQQGDWVGWGLGTDIYSCRSLATDTLGDLLEHILLADGGPMFVQTGANSFIRPEPTRLGEA